MPLRKVSQSRGKTSSRHVTKSALKNTSSTTTNNGGFPRSSKSAAKTPSEYMKGRLAIKTVTMNLSGQSVMGLTPAYKLNHIRDYLESSSPDVVFIQDGVREEDLTEILNEASNYSCEFQALPQKYKELREMQQKNEDDLAASVKSLGPPPPQTAIVWNKEKYFGTPLELSDNRLGDLATWVQRHNLTVVKVFSIFIKNNEIKNIFVA